MTKLQALGLWFTVVSMAGLFVDSWACLIVFAFLGLLLMILGARK